MFQAGPPYVFKKDLTGIPMETQERMSFREKYEGFVVDLIQKLSQEVKFKYEMYLVADKKYGNYDEKTGSWTGLIKDLRDHVSLTKYHIMMTRTISISNSPISLIPLLLQG